MLIRAETLTLSAIEAIFRGAGPTIDPACRPRVERSAEVVAAAADGEKPVYGINTGFGKLATVRIRKADTAILQRNLVLSHCAGVGEPLDDDVVRLIMTLKLVSLARGASGVRWEVVELLQGMLDKGVIPVIPEKGSVGSSGDLAPLAHMSAVMIGEGEARVGGVKSSGGCALKKVGLRPLVLSAKEGLALLNGTQVSCALALAGLFEAWRATMSSLTTGALSTDAAKGSTTPFRQEIANLRGHAGQIAVAVVLHGLLAGSEIREEHRVEDDRVQDPYCLRCQPQVVGASIDVLRQAGITLQAEARAVTDNPLVLEDGSILSGGNFHGEPIGFAADQVALAIAEVGAITQRRIALLVDPAVSSGLPPFLAPDPGLNSGFMMLDIVSAALAAENKALSNPRVVDSTPTSANQEDHVAMCCHAARRLLEMSRILGQIVAIEAICAAQGIEFRAPLATSPMLSKVMARIRAVVPRLEQDRVLSPDLAMAERLVREGRLVPPEPPSLEMST